ncbi:helix-turn-helix domain-containing protein [Microbacterium sp. G2-8]|uniref:helix-turn-helix domain-containing protein n=1 Tax=Microbacterium sp. G2-8 TaxID=2842454 RepID=UPI001C8A37BE|nr:AraC family transcriptional regulator [Microbacterium sp. G2-8]
MGTADTVEPLEQALAAMEWRVLRGRRIALAPGEAVRMRVGVATLGYVVSGDLVGVAGDRCVALPRGGAVVSMGRVPISLRAASGAEVVVAELEPADPLATSLLPDVLTVADFADVEPTIAQIASDIGHPSCRAPRAANGTICSLMATTVVLAAVRAWAERGCAPEGWPMRSADPFLSRVLDAIHADPGRSWSVGELAAIGAMSRTVFAERFRGATGQTPAAYLNTLRIDQAKELLESGRSVADTARSLGYGSDEGFSRAFRRRTGIAPSGWRHRLSATRPADTNSTAPTAAHTVATA